MRLIDKAEVGERGGGPRCSALPRQQNLSLEVSCQPCSRHHESHRAGMSHCQVDDPCRKQVGQCARARSDAGEAHTDCKPGAYGVKANGNRELQRTGEDARGLDMGVGVNDGKEGMQRRGRENDATKNLSSTVRTGLRAASSPDEEGRGVGHHGCWPHDGVAQCP